MIYETFWNDDDDDDGNDDDDDNNDDDDNMMVIIMITDYKQNENNIRSVIRFTVFYNKLN